MTEVSTPRTPRQQTPRQQRTPRDSTPRQTPRDSTPRQTPRDSTPRSSSTRRPEKSYADSVATDSRAHSARGGSRRAASARPASARSANQSAFFEDEVSEESELDWPVIDKPPRAAPNDLRRRIARISSAKGRKQTEEELADKRTQPAGKFGYPHSGQQSTDQRMEMSYSARAARDQKLKSAAAIDHYRVLEPDWPGTHTTAEQLRQQKRTLGPEKENFFQGTKTIRSVPGYTGFVPAKKSETVYGASHEKIARMATGWRRMEIDRMVSKEASAARLSKACIPGYGGHVPTRRDETFFRSHGESTRRAEKIFKSRQREMNATEPQRPRRHENAGPVLPEGAWFGNAPHYALAGECSSTHRITMRGARHDPGALAFDKPPPDPIDWRTGVVLRLR